MHLRQIFIYSKVCSWAHTLVWILFSPDWSAFRKQEHCQRQAHMEYDETETKGRGDGETSYLQL